MMPNGIVKISIELVTNDAFVELFPPRHCLHATLKLRTKAEIFAIDLRMKADSS